MSDEIGFGEHTGCASITAHDDHAYAGPGKARCRGLQRSIKLDHRQASRGGDAQTVDLHDVLQEA
jgi:hypothetical protein